MKAPLRTFFVLSLTLLVQFIFAQEKTVTGTVVDQNGMPLPGVNVLVKGSTNGAQTDFDGNYSVQANVGDVLVFSYIGQKTEERTVAASGTMDITLIQDAEALDEVVVTGLGIKREKKALGYSQQSVNGDQLIQARETDVANAVAGKISGVQIVGNNSSTFGESRIRLRGNDDLLYVVDGIRIYNSSDINTNNIADISVLKGASATAIYGPEGRNGVVIITSKTGTSGVAKFQIDHSMGLNSVATLPDYQDEYGGGYSQTFNVFEYDPSADPAEWAAFDGQKYPDFWADESWGPRLDGQMVRHWDSWIQDTPEFGKLRPWTKSPNGIRSFYDTALTTNTTLSFSKAGDKYNIMSTATYINQNGVIPNSSNKSMKISINGSYNVTEKLKFIANINLEDRDMLNNPDQNYNNLGSNFNQWWQRQLDFKRLRNYVRNSKTVSWNIRGPRDARPLYWDSPYFHSYENEAHWNKNTYFAKLGIQYEINDHLNFVFDVRKTFHSYMWDDRATTISLLDPASYEEEHYRHERQDFFGMLNYNNRFFNDNLDVDLSVGGEKIKKDYRGLNATTNGDLMIPDFYNLAGSQDPVTATNETEREKRNGLFAKASFGYKSTLYLDGSYRLDWSSTARSDANRVETYGGSLSFLLHNVLPDNDVLTFAKLRAGYASAPFFPDPYLTKNVYDVGSLYQGTGRIGVSDTQENPALKGGVRDEFEVGAELQFLRNRIYLDLTYYNRIDTDLPINVPLDGATGYSNITVNSGQQTTKGFEIGLTGEIFKSEDVSWELGVNFATMERVVDELYPGIDARDLSTYTSNIRLQERVGEKWGLFYGTGFATDDKGNIMFTENDGNYYYSIQQNKFLGSLLPDFTGGITSNFKYKNISLALGFDFQKGGKYYSRTERYMDHSGLASYTAGLNDKGNPKRDPAASGGGEHIVGVLQTGIDDQGNPVSDGTVVDTYVDPQVLYNLGNLGNIYENNLHDASYVKLRTVRVGYDFNKSLIEKFNLSAASISVFANNLWLISSDLPWIDPSELEKRSDINWAEAGTLPMTRTIGVNLNLTF
ncbi:SusC/RagA family TonB-linked outer membrane protein [Sinomicrobium weinanense]|uniref:SusC/RagA family TonB-linked outer membrane protein n=1 Tax=Sinomicrobium weinanense TaxID=2842200 RepID=A0A926JS50_9FLAO|nr:SusC/RagA family TonB-linked outer membrane protein [Sinomicrobium weinanense]MBC9796369.1 SusC/RagA family TonB-linked outer membrane protein [Sinomicrobium weinanense]MBU3122630.1 SusC/RagA family TonB-linked outer membrane protein [Sinomicrobium weinanense]